MDFSIDVLNLIITLMVCVFVYRLSRRKKVNIEPFKDMKLRSDQIKKTDLEMLRTSIKMSKRAFASHLLVSKQEYLALISNKDDSIAKLHPYTKEAFLFTLDCLIRAKGRVWLA